MGVVRVMYAFGIAECIVALFPGRFGREKRPGNFREFKLYTDVMLRNCISHSSSKFHVILLIFSPAENGPFLVVEATVCAGSATEVKQETNEQKSSCRVPTLARSSDVEWA